ncbi:MAG TPA: hypothetical protein VN811_04635 [Thermoanaerobaculia bacterium]|nr:hypothetical protein [Thermoanaerobaculia bacterium]HXT50303.1 hypothetical protein [Thermoanaerobaculia bacterium]
MIAQNLYRLKDGRFEQVGLSWLKHGFQSLNQNVAGCSGAGGASCAGNVAPYFGNVLGVGCTDPYVSWLNGQRPYVGPSSEVNGTTGELVIPHSTPGTTTSWEGRLKVATTDVDSSVNPPETATFWAEAQYIAGDDAMTGNGLNNASYQQVTVGAAATDFALTRTGSFVEQQPAIDAWKAQDPTVSLIDVDVPGTPIERYQVARKVTDIGGGFWHYEYAVRNHNSDRSARALTIDFPLATSFSGIGFHDVEHHSGEPFATTDWSVATTSTQISWFTDTYAVDPDANALRFATLFNFWFDADQPPGDNIANALELFKPGTPSSVPFNRFNELFINGFETGATNAWSVSN